MKKAYEYSKMCDADVCVGMRLRETGQVYILSSDTTGFWAFVRSQLVCCLISTILNMTDYPELSLPSSEIDYGSGPRGG